MGMVFGIFKALPLVWKLGSLAVLVAGLAITYGIWHRNVYMKGWRAHEAAIVRQDEKAIGAALAKRRVFDDCRDRGLRWDQSTGKCEGR